MADEEVIESIEGEAWEEAEVLPAVRPRQGMLLRGSEPTEQLAHAMGVAKALADVIDQQELYKNISGKKHVLVEGWELLGSLLGVFPVVEWTRQVENGWEARVVAKTLDGSEVGSAEMMCTRAENRWRTADDYAIRSMAQTRAISKALRGPLGFVMKLAGYEPTPEGELPTESGSGAPQRPFDPERDLMQGAITDPHEIPKALDGFDPTVDWQETLSALTIAVYQETSWRTLDETRRNDFWRRLANAVQWIREHTPAGDFPPVEEKQITQGLAYAFSGTIVKPVYKEIPVPEAVLSAEDQARIEEALAAPDDIPFGYEREE
jgi:hypothetical protein